MPDLPGQAEIDDHPDPGNGDEAVDLNERLEERLDEPARIEREAAVQAGDRIMQLFAGREDDPAVLHRQLPREGVLVQNFIMNVNQADPAQARQIEALREDVAVLRQQVQAIHDGPAVGPIRIKYVLIACGVLGGLSAVLSIIFTLKNGLTGSRSLAQVVGPLAHAPDSLPPVDPHDAAHIKSYWLRNTEAEFWDALASFVEAEKPRSFQEQLLFSQLTLDMANAMPAATWVWNAPGDKVALVEQLADCIQKQGLSAAYRSLPGMTYGDAKPFPRSVAAELISLGLARWQQLYT